MPRGKTARGAVTRINLVEAGWQVFCEKGYEGATIRDIALVAGLSSATLYMHFPDKESLLLAACEPRLEALQSTLQTLPQTGSPADRVLAIVEAVLSWGLENEGVFELFLGAGARPPVPMMQARGHAVEATCLEALEKAMSQLVEAGGGLADRSLIVCAVWASAIGVFNWCLRTNRRNQMGAFLALALDPLLRELASTGCQAHSDGGGDDATVH